MQEVWRLTIEKDNTQCVTIFGTEEVLRRAQDEWIQWCSTSALTETRDDEGLKAQIIDGITDSADRGPVRLAYRYCDVVGMCLVLVAR